MILINKKILVFTFLFLFISGVVYCQDTTQLLSQVTELAKESKTTNDMLGGFSVSLLFGGIIFGLIGIAAFSYGKKTAQFKPMIVGVALMIYPYFTRSTLVLYLIGSVLTGLLFINISAR